MKFRYIYKITCTKGRFKNCFYYGQHTTTNINDNYKGSGVLLGCYFKKYPNDYIKEILCFCNTQEELDKTEYDIIHPNLSNPMCLNLSEGGTGGSHPAWNKGIPLNEKQKRKLIEVHKGKKISEETRQKMSETHKLWHQHHIVSEETRQKLSKINKNKIISEEQKKKISESHKGKKLSEEHKRKISESQKGIKKKPFSEEHKRKLSEIHKGKIPYNKGQSMIYKWMTNGITSKFVHKDDWNTFIDNGFKFGRK